MNFVYAVTSHKLAKPLSNETNPSKISIISLWRCCLGARRVGFPTYFARAGERALMGGERHGLSTHSTFCLLRV